MAKRKLTPEQLTTLYQEYEAGAPRKQLLERYGITTRTFYKYKTERGIPNRYFGYNDINFFKTIDTEEKAYWLGFIAADGCICPKAHAVRIALAWRDHRHLFRLRKAIGIDTRIAPMISSNGRGQWLAVYIHVVSKDMIDHLKRYGIKQHKTYNLEWPNITEALARHFIRGYLDGDGCWTITWGSHNLSLEIVGRLPFLQAVQKRFIDKCQVKTTKIGVKANCAALYTLRYAGNIQCLRLANWLYAGSTIYLPRKRSIVIDHYSVLPKHRDKIEFE